jgi:hypothetical protein
MVANLQAPVICQCTATRTGTIPTAGGRRPVFIMELENETFEEKIIKFFGCNLSEAGNHSVPHNSDFAKLYRTTIGSNPTKRFSKAHQLLPHLSSYYFAINYKLVEPSRAIPYLKVTRIKPKSIVRNDAWTLDGTLKKIPKNSPFKTLENGDEMATDWRQSGETMATDWRRHGDGETLEASKSLGLDAIFHPTKKRPDQGKTTNTLDHVCDADLFVNLTDTAQGFYNERLNVLLKNFGFESPEAETLAMQAVFTKYEQTAYLSKPVSQQNNDEWLAAFNGMEQATWN